MLVNVVLKPSFSIELMLSSLRCLCGCAPYCPGVSDPAFMYGGGFELVQLVLHSSSLLIPLNVGASMRGCVALGCVFSRLGFVGGIAREFSGLCAGEP